MPESRLQRFRLLEDEAGGIASGLNRSPYVGRTELLLSLRNAVSFAATGSKQMKLLAGEPGIGKTRTLAEIAEFALGNGFLVVKVGAQQPGYSPPMWLWRSLVTQLMPHSDNDTFSRRLAAFVDGRTSSESSSRSDRAVDHSREQFELFNEITILLKSIAGSRPLLLIFDDLQWADDSTIELLQFVFQNSYGASMAILGGFRDTEVTASYPLHRLVARLSGEGGFDVEAVRRLSLDEVIELAAASTGVDVDTNTLREVAEKAEGHPFFALSLAEGLLIGGSGDRRGCTGRSYLSCCFSERNFTHRCAWNRDR